MIKFMKDLLIVASGLAVLSGLVLGSSFSLPKLDFIQMICLNRRERSEEGGQ